MDRRLPVGAEVVEASGRAAVDFRVWAPGARTVELVLEPDGRRLELRREAGGYAALRVDGLAAGARYRFALDGGEPLADPASRSQPEGPMGPSEVIDPSVFGWTDAAWRGVAAADHVLYELHVGTFSPEGTWAAATEQLPFLAELGVTTIELLPVNEFAGEFGWGYDGVLWFAPSHLYGRPDDLRRLVDRAHGLGLGVILDVVYNHLGSVGNYMPRFGPYRSTLHENEWGDPINFDGPDAAGVRELTIANAGYWIDEFHLDGLRLDATQAILDDSDEHIVAALVRRAREVAGPRTIFTVAENERADVRYYEPPPAGFGLDAMWNDDFHHSARVAATGVIDGYLQNYAGSPQELIWAIKRGFLYQGQMYPWQDNPRGTVTAGLPRAAFVHFLTNHDQAANGGRGARLGARTTAGRERALTALLCLGPSLPMLFQGQETGSRRPWTYFADHDQPLAGVVRNGRAAQMAEFESQATREGQAALRDPSARATFDACVLDPAERSFNRPTVRLHRDLLALRRQVPAFRGHGRGDVDGAVLAAEAFALRFFGAAADGSDDRLLLINLGPTLRRPALAEPLVAPPTGSGWRLSWSSEDPSYDGVGTPEVYGRDGFSLPAHAAVVLEPDAGATLLIVHPGGRRCAMR